MIHIILADYQPLTAAGFVHVFERMNDVALMDCVKSRSDFLPLLRKHTPHLVIADCSREDYILPEDILEVCESGLPTNILIISSYDEPKSILAMLKSGVKGYLTKDCSEEEIVSAVRTTARGEKFFCQKILDLIIEGPVKEQAETERTFHGLTQRELELLNLLAKGYSTQRAADTLHLSPHTIHTHRKKIIKKLDIKSPTQFVIYAIEFGLIKPE